MRSSSFGVVGVCGGEGGVKWFVGVVGGDQTMTEVLWFCCEFSCPETSSSFGTGRSIGLPTENRFAPG